MIRDFSGNITNYFESNESEFETLYVNHRRKLFEAESESNSKLYELHENNKLQLRKEKINEIISNVRFKSYELSVYNNSIRSKFQNLNYLKELNEIIKHDKNLYKESEILDVIIDLLKKQLQELSLSNSLPDLIFIYKYLINNLYSSQSELERTDLLKDNEENQLGIFLQNINKQTQCLNDLISINSDCFEEYLKDKAKNNKMKKLQKIITNFTKFDLNYPEYDTSIIEIKTNCIDIMSNIISITNCSISYALIEDLIVNIKEITIHENSSPTFISGIICFFNNLITRINNIEPKEIALEIITNILIKLNSPKIKGQCLSFLLDLVKSNDFILLSILKKNDHNLIEILFNLINKSVFGCESIEDMFYPSISILNKFLINKDTREVFSHRYSITDFLMNILKNVDIIKNKKVATNTVHSLLLSFSANEVKNLKIEFITSLDQILSLTSWKETIEDILNIYNIILDNSTVELYDEIVECGIIKTIVNLIDNEMGYNRNEDNFIVLCVLILFGTFIRNDTCFKFKKKLKKLHLCDNIESILSNLYNQSKNKLVLEKVSVILRYLDR